MELCFRLLLRISDNKGFLIIWRVQLLFTQENKTLLKKVCKYGRIYDVIILMTTPISKKWYVALRIWLFFYCWYLFYYAKLYVGFSSVHYYMKFWRHLISRILSGHISRRFLCGVVSYPNQNIFVRLGLRPEGAGPALIPCASLNCCPVIIYPSLHHPKQRYYLELSHP